MGCFSVFLFVFHHLLFGRFVSLNGSFPPYSYPEMLIQASSLADIIPTGQPSQAVWPCWCRLSFPVLPMLQSELAIPEEGCLVLNVQLPRSPRETLVPAPAVALTPQLSGEWLFGEYFASVAFYMAASNSSRDRRSPHLCPFWGPLGYGYWS